MRAHTFLGRGAIRFGIMAAAFSGLAFATTQAHAGDVVTGGAAGGPNESYGSAALKYEHTQGLSTDIRTNWDGVKIANLAKVAVNVGIKLEPVTNGGPLFTVDMPKGANVEATWGSDKKILLKAQTGSQTDGVVTVRHTLVPSINLKVTGGVNLELGYDATQLVNLIPGARFNYDSRAQQQFAPWGWNPVETKLNAPDLDRAVLFEMGFDQMGVNADTFDGDFGVRATTKPTFAYKTTKIFFSGANGELNNATSELVVPAIDGDFMEVMTSVEGDMQVKGGVTVQPFIKVRKLGDFALGGANGMELAIDAYTQNYTTELQKVNFQTVLVHIPMPNVRVPTRGVNVGDVKVGSQATKTIQIENTGEKEASLSFETSDNAFQVPSQSVIVPAKSSYELVVKFNPDSASPAKADIKVISNDADAPEQMFQIGANGADVGGGENGADGFGPRADDGCGCKAAGHSSTPGYAGFGLLGLGAVVLFRRRRTAA
jgi:MYXO-CTERM domain-containing protein